MAPGASRPRGSLDPDFGAVQDVCCVWLPGPVHLFVILLCGIFGYIVASFTELNPDFENVKRVVEAVRKAAPATNSEKAEKDKVETEA